MESGSQLISSGPPIDGSGGEIWDPDTEQRSSSLTNMGSAKEWDVIVVNDPKMVNAMAVPGMIIVFTGILPVCGDEQGLSVVLSHEIAHVVARHAAERISSQTIMISSIILLNLIGVNFDLSRTIEDLMFKLPNSRAQEREADYIGLKLMARGCFDPKAAPKVFDRLDKIESKIGPKFMFDFLETHPSSKSRVEYLEQLLPEAFAIRASNTECAEMEKKVCRFRNAGHEIRVIELRPTEGVV
ncbi:hypothetical protein AX15_000973 [Amanita polypyramis BW_CC]|nr:hypothetical protein AX15_000973 [Amanita polypyramis BW_CC]